MVAKINLIIGLVVFCLLLGSVEAVTIGDTSNFGGVIVGREGGSCRCDLTGYGNISGTGTTNRFAYFTSANTIAGSPYFNFISALNELEIKSNGLADGIITMMDRTTGTEFRHYVDGSVYYINSLDSNPIEFINTMVGFQSGVRLDNIPDKDIPFSNAGMIEADNSFTYDNGANTMSVDKIETPSINHEGNLNINTGSSGNISLTSDDEITFTAINKIRFLDKITSPNISTNMTWTDLYGYPVGCPAGTYVTNISDTITCASAGGSMNYTNIAMKNESNIFDVGKTQRIIADLLVGNDTGGAYSCSGTPSFACDEFGEDDCLAMQEYGYCEWDGSCYDNSGMSCGMTTSVDCAIGGCNWLSGKLNSNINVTGRIKASCSGDGGAGKKPCIGWTNEDGFMQGGFSNSADYAAPYYSQFYQRGNSSITNLLAEWNIQDASYCTGADCRVSYITTQRASVGSGEFTTYLGIRNTAGTAFINSLQLKQNGGVLIGGTGTAEPLGLTVAKNLSVGQLIKLQTSILPTCTTAIKNVFGANATGVYGCNGTGWGLQF